MLKSVLIENFQIHSRMEIEFDPCVTTIVGKSDTGKSSILRAIKWLVTNRPGGDEFIRQGCDEVRVSLTSEEWNITRSKGGKEGNTYTLNGSVFKAFGTDIPDEINRVLNIGIVTWGNQHDPPFWFGLSPGQVSKELNAVVNLDLIDSALAAAASEVRRAKATVQVSEDRLAAARERREGLRWVKQAAADFTALEQKHDKLSKDCEKRSRIASLLETALQLTSEGQNASQALSCLSKVVSLGEKAVQSGERAEQLSELLVNIVDKELQTCNLRAEADAAEAVWAEALKGTCPLCNRRSE